MRTKPVTRKNKTAIELAQEELRYAKEEAERAKEEALKAKEQAESLAQFPLHNPHPLLKIDVDKAKLLFVNPAGYNSYSDLLTLGLKHPLLKDVHEIALRAFVQNKPFTREITVGDITYNQTIAPNVMEEERTATIYCYDISQLKETEARLRAERRKAEQANHAKGDFLANMSHELRTPMNGVLGMAGLLMNTKLDKEQEEYVSTIRKSGESLLLLLNDILDFSKIDAGELSLEEAPFDLHHTMKATAGLLEPLAKEKNIDFDVTINPACARFVLGDSARLRQIVTNLLSNALKFTSEGYVKLDVSSQRRDATTIDVIFRVDDTGIGIPDEKLDTIFNKFTQADESTNRRFGGTGLGLAISKQLCEMMGGRIGVESVEGAGSSFWFCIPMTLATAQHIKHLEQEEKRRIATKKRPDESYDFSQKSVIVIDDHPINLLFAKKLLDKFGFGLVDTAIDGKSALDMIKTGNYDIIITDCQMPEMDGYQVTRMIRERETDSKNTDMTPIIAMTANALIGDKEKCLASGMNDYVSKPISEIQLHEVLAKWLSCGAMCDVTFPIPQKNLSQPTTALDEPPVDLERLRMFLDGDPEEEQEIINMFLSHGQQTLHEIQQAFAAHNDEEWRANSHKLKGSAMNFGANQLAKLCFEAETHPKSSEDNKKQLLSAIESEMIKIQHYLQS